MKSLFEIGQKIVCVDSKGHHGLTTGLIEGKSYEILGISKSPCCGIVNVNVGLTSGRRLLVCKCGDEREEITDWFRQTRFVPLDFDKQTDEMVREQLNEKLKITL